MLNIELGEFNGDSRELNKSINNIISVNCEIYGDNTLLSPVFLLNFNNNLLNKNYAYIPEWNKYYYIVQPLTMSKGGRCFIYCQEDVRMTYRNEILNLECYVVRNQYRCNTLIVDEYYPAEIMSTLCTLKFNASPFSISSSDRNIVMCVYGGQKV